MSLFSEFTTGKFKICVNHDQITLVRPYGAEPNKTEILFDDGRQAVVNEAYEGVAKTLLTPNPLKAARHAECRPEDLPPTPPL